MRKPPAPEAPRPHRFESHPRLAALVRGGTRHVYADTADVAELHEQLVADGAFPREIDGNTVNQPLVHKVIDRYLAAGVPGEADSIGLDDEPPAVRRYAALCARIGRDVAGAFAGGRRFDVSLQLHMDLVADPAAAVRVGRALHRAVPGVAVKVPFAPYAPATLLVARDLAAEGIPVNLTSTFSARQAVTAALFTNCALTNVFMGRLTQGLRTEGLGEHVSVGTQRHLRRLREEDGARTELIVASVREGRTFERAAGCDAFTAPCEAIASFLSDSGIDAAALRDRVAAEEDVPRPDVPAEVSGALASPGIERLWRVETELVELLRELRPGGEASSRLRGGDEVFRAFDRAGFGDLFHSPDREEWEEIRRGKLPDLGGRLVARIPIDTLFSLLADADFEAHQAKMDSAIARRRAA